jgi:dTDP-4-amino-4,6-dideoxygalactose transaminase
MTTLPFTRPTIGAEELQAVREVLESGWITTGPKSLALEQALADYIGGGVQVRVFNSATSGLEASLLVAGIGPGDEVIVPAISFVATANVVLRVGARPVFVDVDLHSRNLDAAAVAAAMTPNTRAVIPVHFAGLAVNMEPLYALAAEHDLLLLEDAAQAIGTEYQGRKIGASGNPVCFSFHPNKNMTTIEGGAVASDDAEFISRLEQVRFHGIEKDSDGNIDVTGWGGKMNLPDVNAAVGLAQLSRLDSFNRRRRELVELCCRPMQLVTAGTCSVSVSITWRSVNPGQRCCRYSANAASLWAHTILPCTCFPCTASMATVKVISLSLKRSAHRP